MDISQSQSHGASPPSRNEGLPSYTNQQKVQKPKEFQYKVEKNGKAIAVLTLLTQGALSRTMPTYSEGSFVKGNVSLSLDRPDSIKSVDVAVQGRFITGVNPDDQINFIDISHSLWSLGKGAPRNVIDANSSTPSTEAQSTKKFSGKLCGEYMWPFAIELPRKVDMPSIGRIALGSFAPPQTFNERNIPVTVYYEISVRIVRGRLRTDRRMSTQFGYIPLTRPPYFPPLRLIAYQKGTALVGPNLNVDEWHSESVIPIQGKEGSSVNINCTLYLSKPLVYTRGSLIPLCIKLESSDTAALGLLSSSEGIVVCLRRTVKYGIPEKKANTKIVAYKDIKDDFTPAVWWPSPPGPDDPKSPLSENIRYINGEIHLKSDLKPTSDMPLLRVDYSVGLLPFNAPGFTYAGREHILQVPVEIVTAYAPGPRPVKSAPPIYGINGTMASVNK